MTTDKKFSFLGISLPLGNLYIFLSILSLICFGIVVYLGFFIYPEKPSNDMIIAIAFLLMLSIILGFVGFPKWIEEDREDREIRSKKRELEKKKGLLNKNYLLILDEYLSLNKKEVIQRSLELKKLKSPDFNKEVGFYKL